MPYTFSELREIETRINQELPAARKKLAAIKKELSDHKEALRVMVNTYAGGWKTDIESALAADPNNTALQALDAAKDLLVAEFQTLKTTVDALNTALNG